MEGLIPFILRAVKKQTPQNIYRSLSENSTSGRSYHLLLTRDSVEGSSHRRTCSDYQPPSAAIHFDTNNGLRQRAITSAGDYKVSGGISKYGGR
ncbi:hypothetical protein PHJA_002084700 [Phtheirospermum japonicum]|uniref:Uncharacterized protein n=1 Tax=Phtheirospermum japonicum TaxID=374723 RepID=A0A830CJC6_9LAMI|nr:hypothetical protein PHJA_002084700 [Phtheirospermum japonicum]